ncbi:UDP-N-acetylmuramoyl-L-alanyl-D-glutamate--2,6-diaminopimelate ligase [Microbacteriaceae bacterium VKM Ac-2854]|nr:UDP-N-acetylmuramoyl-L-alanyl-D-glutamate--2,6-diaminopimelate ligase [Microbacteriaceae bacterium VKM Ac-2854]
MLRPTDGPTNTLAELTERFGFERTDDDDHAATTTDVAGVTLDSTDVRPGDLFVGISGARRHGAELAEEAEQAGAAAILTDARGAELAQSASIPVIVTADPRAELGDVSAYVYGTSVRTPTLFGVTGTNGKTSTVHMTEAILRQMGVTAGLSSTAERHIGGESVISGLTTPEATELHAMLATMNQRGVTAAAIEVSAQALTRHRVDGVVFDVAGFTNLSHDHLDDYGDMDTYFEAKAPLFQPDRSRRAVISLDSPAGYRMVERAGVPVATIASDPAADADWTVTIVAEEPAGARFTVTRRDGRAITTFVPVIGRHMAADAGLAIAMLVEAGWAMDEIRAVLHRDGGIDVRLPGRTELVSGELGPHVYVDFGHSPDAFENTLAAVRRVTTGRVIMLFGADGDRDTLKRPAMAAAAVLGSDILVVTDHHPRFEDPDAIRRVLVESARAARPDGEIHEVGDPKRAIRYAISLADEGDAILWAGPGHQNYRDIRGVRTPYSARAEARAALSEAGWDAATTPLLAG